MAENKTKPMATSPADFIAAVEPAAKRADAQALCEMMERLSGWKATMWGPTIIGFGRYRYRYDSGREGENLVVGFSPRKPNLVLYLNPGVEHFPEQLARLGKHTTGASCLYVKRLADIDVAVLEEMIQSSLAYMRVTHGEAIQAA
jgi:hypothetical protein